MIRIFINDDPVPAREGATILEASREDRYASRQFDIKVPMLNCLKGVKAEDDSGLCVVEVEGADGLVNASTAKVRPEMRVRTKTDAVKQAQMAALEAILEVHDLDCRHCRRTGNCELQDLQWKFRTTKSKETAKRKVDAVDDSSIVVRDPNKCIRCGRCVAACSQVQSVGAIEFQGEGLNGRVVPANGALKLADTNCVHCGQCIASCPVGALYERNDVDAVLAAIADPSKFVIIQTAPSVRAALGEQFRYPVGSEVEGKMAAALRRVGFDRVFDTDFGADLTVMEEAAEFIDRFQNGGVLPMTTSCCPGWIKFAEQEFGDMLDHVSSCKSPHEMFGAVVKGYLAEKEGINPASVVVVSAMPCTAKKFECARPELAANGAPDVDYALTVRELGELIKKAKVPFIAMPDEPFDTPIGAGSGAGTIFGVTGGVMEAALRTAADWIAGEDLPRFEYREVRGVKGVKESMVSVAGKPVRVAVVSGLANARALMDKVRAGEADYDFIEVMACPGGCVNGGGQPQQKASTRLTCDLRTERGNVLYSLDERATVRKSHENPQIVELYESYLGEPGNERAHELLHTGYTAR